MVRCTSATASAGVEQVLREAGEPELADEWASTARQPDADPDAAGDLRYRVMLAVEQSPAQARLLTAPAIRDIATALTASGNDALAYLLPRDEEGPGIAVIVGADGTIRRLPLPGLYTGGGSLVTAFIRTRRAVETAEVAEAADGGSPESAARTAAARSDWLGVLGTLCGWAWRTVVRPLLDALSAPDADGGPRIVLVPAAELGLVPWHAAREPMTGQYACQRAEFSYAPTARQFIDSSARRPRPWTQAPVLISDASGSLYLTAVGLAYLHDAQYPSAKVFWYAHSGWTRGPRRPGRLARRRARRTAAGRNARCLAAALRLPRAGAGAGPRLQPHARCRRQRHRGPGRGAGHPGAGQDGPEHGRAAGRCPRTRRPRLLPDRCHRERLRRDAHALATAFLAAGAAGVIAARWTVAAGVTGLVWNVFQQFLNVPGTRPGRALRAAQLWMLDQDQGNSRRVAAGPCARKRPWLTRWRIPGLASPQAWASFTYQGW